MNKPFEIVKKSPAKLPGHADPFVTPLLGTPPGKGIDDGAC